VVVTGRRAPERRLVFQYNPSRLIHRVAGAGDDRRETIELTLDLDACDRLEQPEDHPTTVELGLLPELAALRGLVELAPVRRARSLWERLFGGRSDGGSLVLLVWGEQRTVPVKVTSLIVREELFDPELRPIRARARVMMSILSERDLPADHHGRQLVKAHRDRLAVLSDQAFGSD
jgi:hypothetical protein